MKAYSLDLRTRVIAAVQRGMPDATVAATFGVSVSTIKRWWRLHRAGDLTPRAIPGRPARLHDTLVSGLAAQLAARPDATLAEHCATWTETTGQVVSAATMRRAIVALGWTRKKSP
jgi:transposase